jgi:predicted O-methyltransferase YrrM
VTEVEQLQVRSEFDHLAATYRNMRPQRVLEIGVWMGGTLRVWLRDCGRSARVVAVDLDHPNRDAYSGWTKYDTSLVVEYGRSQDPNTVTKIQRHAPYDFVFIDGDHGYAAVRADVDVCLPLVSPGGVLAMHDIVGGFDFDGAYGPGIVANELEAAGHPVERIIDPTPNRVAHGIALISL